ncbi:hypothetical protein D2A34_22010 [Clostridium chromiireducens]|uniref:EF-hand domain-containing protein n=1 Tax=Clostridium chromiireducens TaxID=225345 RepID=A0A399IN50_9CLOT|nr:hypothetical protein [Clostridium chromiireducens]RII32872.1 hypothetical protein D2A34_22010 [Clostridium chromiireducens]
MGKKENNMKLSEPFEAIKLVAYDVVEEKFTKMLNVDPEAAKIKSKLTVNINLGWDDEKSHIILKTDMSIVRKLKVSDEEEKTQSELSLTTLNIYEGETIKSIIDELDNDKEDNLGEQEFTNYLFNLAYPKIKKHIEYIFKNSNMQINLPKKLKVGE